MSEGEVEEIQDEARRAGAVEVGRPAHDAYASELGVRVGV